MSVILGRDRSPIGAASESPWLVGEAGYHQGNYRFSRAAGSAMGKKIGELAVAKYLRPPQ
jgi:hypothetical protein